VGFRVCLDGPGKFAYAGILFTDHRAYIESLYRLSYSGYFITTNFSIISATWIGKIIFIGKLLNHEESNKQFGRYVHTTTLTVLNNLFCLFSLCNKMRNNVGWMVNSFN
jgi:hypothetical protein